MFHVEHSARLLNLDAPWNISPARLPAFWLTTFHVEHSGGQILFWAGAALSVCASTAAGVLAKFVPTRSRECSTWNISTAFPNVPRGTFCAKTRPHFP